MAGSETSPGKRPIVTITLNPALDVSTAVPAVTPDHKLRCDEPSYEPGGGGINVARVATRLGEHAVALAVLGGTSGDRIEALLSSEKVPVLSIPALTDTRQSISITEKSTGRQYRFVMPGPVLSDQVLSTVIEQASRVKSTPGSAMATRSPVVVVSGSVPDGGSKESFQRLISSLADHFDAVLVDTSGEALVEALSSPATLVKPSARELAGLLNRPLNDEGDVVAAVAEVLRQSQVGAVLASIGAGGAVLATKGSESGEISIVRLRAPAVNVRSTVGAGDSLVGGVAVGLVRGLPLVEAAALGIAAGTAAVCTEGSGLCQPDQVDRLLPLVLTQQELG